MPVGLPMSVDSRELVKTSEGQSKRVPIIRPALSRFFVRAVRDLNPEKRVRPGGEADGSMPVSEASDDAAAKPILKRVPIIRPALCRFFVRAVRDLNPEERIRNQAKRQTLGCR